MVNKIKEFLRNTIFYILYKKFRALFFKYFYGNPVKDLFIIGVTWTDGKTTTTNLIHKIISDNLWKACLISTALIKIWDEVLNNEKKMTSFDPKDLYKILAYAKWKDIKYVVLEVSSHWLDQYRFEGIDFDMWVLTNITPEHLDYHKTFEEYILTKRKLFENIVNNDKSSKMAVLPKDDEVGRMWMEDMVFEKFIDYGILTSATLRWENIKEYIDGLEFDIKYLTNKYHVKSKLLWKFNVYNILASVWVWILLKIKVEDIIKSIENFEWIPGRLQLIEKDSRYFFVDFAHTPNALKVVLDYLNNIKWNWKIITVFGAPWNRDKFKRPKMWEIVQKNSDFFIITDDDPDTEDRYFIISNIWDWLDTYEWDRYFVIPDRKKAIDFAKYISSPGDIILVAWKGHENIQLTNFGKINYSDVDYINSL